MATEPRNGSAEQRRANLLELIRTKRFASLTELVEQLGVSESTVRRDLEAIEERGEAKRIHGGVLYAGNTPGLPHFDEQTPGTSAQKSAIARAALKLLDKKDSVFLDGGSTTYQVAQLLRGLRMHVVTNSLPVANLLAPHPESDLILIGGNVCAQTGVVRGPLANGLIQSLRVRKTILSVAGICEDGFFNNNLLVVETEKAMMQIADEVIIVADSSKIGRRSLANLCQLNEVTYLVTDKGISPEWQKKLEAAGVKLIIAETNAIKE
jgi:DeoR/GlpR family transcriptional regulator of sugar metabolism